MKKPIIFLAFSALFFAVSCEKKSENQEATNTDTTASQSKMEEKKGLTDDDKDFMSKAAEGGMLEVELGKLAHQKAMKKDVKDYGHMLMTQHEEANNELKQLASAKNVTLPDSLSSHNKDKVKKLSETKASEFDKKYISDMVDDHKDDISEFENAGQKTEDAELKAWIEKTLPHLKHHLAEAQRIDSMMNNSKTGSKKSPISKK